MREHPKTSTRVIMTRMVDVQFAKPFAFLTGVGQFLAELPLFFVACQISRKRSCGKFAKHQKQGTFQGNCMGALEFALVFGRVFVESKHPGEMAICF